jgi:hypothetical protein
MKSAKVFYQGVEIENFSHTGNKVTLRQIQCLMSDVETGQSNVESYLFTPSIAKAKIIIDQIIECGVQIINHKLVLTKWQIFCLQNLTDNPDRHALETWRHTIKVNA